MSRLKKLLTLPFAAAMLAPSALAHCPLCTVGAAAAAGGAAYLGVDTIVIGMFLGAFAASTGYWLAKPIKKHFFKKQKAALIRNISVLAAFVLTIVPLLPLLGEQKPFSVFLAGGYGTLLNRTYVVDVFLIGSLVGLGIVMAAPWASRQISKMRDGKLYLFQGTALTLITLVVVGVLLQLVG